MHDEEPVPRRRSAEATRLLILDTGRMLFAREGYTATTVKRVADAAGVSPNLITRYFGGKDGLFLAAAEPRIAANDVYDGDLDGLGDRLARSIVTRWGAQQGDDPLLVLQRAAGDRPEAAEALAGFLDSHSSRPLERFLLSCGLDPGDAHSRATAVDAFVLGVSMRRRILPSELGDVDDLQCWLASAIQRLATGM